MVRGAINGFRRRQRPLKSHGAFTMRIFWITSGSLGGCNKHIGGEWKQVKDEKDDRLLRQRKPDDLGPYYERYSEGIDNDGDGLIDGEDDNEFGDPRQFATKVAIEKIAEDVLNEIMTTW